MLQARTVRLPVARSLKVFPRVSNISLRSVHASASVMAMSPSEVAVVGAGLAGAACSSRLAEQGKKVSLFDMGGRGPGVVPPLALKHPEFIRHGSCSAALL